MKRTLTILSLYLAVTFAAFGQLPTTAHHDSCCPDCCAAARCTDGCCPDCCADGKCPGDCCAHDKK